MTHGHKNALAARMGASPTIGELYASALMNKSSIAIEYQGSYVSYGQLLDRVHRTTSILASKGLRRSDRVALLARARDFCGGWFHMDDVFRHNDDGSLDFVDRTKYMIKTLGENVYPVEIKRVLMSDVRITEAVIVRVPDAKWGEAQ